MFICLDCEAEFEEPMTYYESQGEYFGAPAWEAFGACPCCGSTEYDEARQCDRCGEWIVDGEWEVINGAHLFLCDVCHDDLFG